MSQLGMQMPGSAARRRGPAMNVYTGLLFLAVVALGAAVAMVWMSATELSPEEGPMAPFTLQEEGQIQFAN